MQTILTCYTDVCVVHFINSFILSSILCFTFCSGYMQTRGKPRCPSEFSAVVQSQMLLLLTYFVKQILLLSLPFSFEFLSLALMKGLPEKQREPVSILIVILYLFPIIYLYICVPPLLISTNNSRWQTIQYISLLFSQRFPHFPCSLLFFKSFPNSFSLCT